MPEMKVNLAGVELKNPIVLASGTCGFGRELLMYIDVGAVGAIAVKGLTLAPRAGNRTPRVAETPSGMLNSIGLQNPGVDAFIKNELPRLRLGRAKVIANISGDTAEQYGELSRILSREGVDMIELNVSCPNVAHGGIQFGVDPALMAEVVREAKRGSGVPVMVKLSPNVSDIAQMALVAEEAGADALSMINTLIGMRIDVYTRRPILANNVGGLSGPAVRPVAVRCVYQSARAVKIPIVGMGGVMTGEDAAEMLLAGASAVGVGTATLVDPRAPIRILEELTRYLERTGVADVRELTGAVKPN